MPDATGTLTINEGAGPFKYGDLLTFTYTAQKLGGGHPMIEVSLYQDTNGDGVIDETLLGPDLVYVTLNKPEQSSVPLGSGSTALDLTKPAKGHARLYNYGWKAKQEYINLLANIDFDVTP